MRPTHPARPDARALPRRLRLVAVAALAAASPVSPAGAEHTLSVAWDSAYVSEGRDNLARGGLWSAAVESAWLGLDLAAWAARGDRIDYRELNLSVAHTIVLGPVEAALSYTRIEYGGAERAPGDNELGLALHAVPAGGWELEVGMQYATRADGAFLHATVARPWETGVAGVVATPYALFGYDAGYATHAHDGPNHVEAGIRIELPLADAWMVSAHLARAFAGRDVRRDGGDDVTWGGAGLRLRF